MNSFLDKKNFITYTVCLVLQLVQNELQQFQKFSIEIQSFKAT